MGMKNFAFKNHTVLNDCIVAVRSPMPKVQTKRVNTLIIIDVHARDIIDNFVRDSVLDEREFAWESQLRFYWEKEIDNVKIRQCSGTFDYGYEYQGLNPPCHPPLTDRCYMTCRSRCTTASAAHPRAQLAPARPRPSRTCPRPCRCSAGLLLRRGPRLQGDGHHLLGLVQTGAWGCFASSTASQSGCSRSCRRRSSDPGRAHRQPQALHVRGARVALVATIGIYITVNPGYAGRAELPDNLKALFRPVVMVVPNLSMICENMLMSEGFGTAKILALKMTVLYKLAEAQLSKQYHYDFKLRALKSVLVMAGGLKRGAPEYDESTILMRALRDMNMPKFIAGDALFG